MAIDTLGEGEDEPEVVGPIRLRAERGPSSLLIWVPAVFFAVLAGGAVLEGLIQTKGRIFLGAVWVGLAAAIAMCVRRKPRYLRELEVTGEVCRGKD